MKKLNKIVVADGEEAAKDVAFRIPWAENGWDDEEFVEALEHLRVEYLGTAAEEFKKDEIIMGNYE